MEILTTDTCDRWIRKLKDVQARARINVVLLLVGGDKSTQTTDISKAKELAAHIRDDKPWE